MTKLPTVQYDTPEEGVARVVLDRPEVRNAQNLAMIYELDAAFERAVQDDSINVIILSGADPHFSSGHDLGPKNTGELGKDWPARAGWGGFFKDGAHGRYAREQEIYLQATRRWRNLSKPTIAAVQGRCIAGGLMLAWACDMIIASEDATFVDPVVAMGVLGVEWFAHPWELGPRKAKELLWTGDEWSAAEAYRLGMVNHVVPRSELDDFTLALARKVARKPTFAVSLGKEAINKAVDLMGQSDAIDYSFGLHQLCHAHNMMRFGTGMDPGGLAPGKAQRLIRYFKCSSIIDQTKWHGNNDANMVDKRRLVSLASFIAKYVEKG